MFKNEKKNPRVIKENYIEKLSEELLWKVVQQFTSGGCPMDCFRELSNNSPWRIVQHICSKGCPKEFYRKSNNVFSRTKTFCFENIIFSYLTYACVRESERA